MWEQPWALHSSSGRIHEISILTSDSFSFSDGVEKLLLLIRSVFSPVDFTEEFERKTVYKRLTDSSVDDQEEIGRTGVSFRNFSDELEFEALPFLHPISSSELFRLL